MISVYKGLYNTERQATSGSLWTEMEFKPTIPLVCAFSPGTEMTGKRVGRIVCFWRFVAHYLYMN